MKSVGSLTQVERNPKYYTGRDILFSPQGCETDSFAALHGVHTQTLQKFGLMMCGIRDALQASGQTEKPPMNVRVSIVTARGLIASRRLLTTLEDWKLFADDVVCLAGRDKTPFLKSLQADIFFDDNRSHAKRAQTVTLSVHVPANETGS